MVVRKHQARIINEKRQTEEIMTITLRDGLYVNSLIRFSTPRETFYSHVQTRMQSGGEQVRKSGEDCGGGVEDLHLRNIRVG